MTNTEQIIQKLEEDIDRICLPLYLEVDGAIVDDLKTRLKKSLPQELTELERKAESESYWRDRERTRIALILLPLFPWDEDENIDDWRNRLSEGLEKALSHPKDSPSEKEEKECHDPRIDCNGNCHCGKRLCCQKEEVGR